MCAREEKNVASQHIPVSKTVGSREQTIGKHFDLLMGIINEQVCLQLASADEHSPEPIYEPQTRRCNHLIGLHPHETGSYHDS